MTYDQWFRSQQGIAYEGSYLFAEAAWEHQQKRIDALEHETMTPEMVSLLKSTIRERNETLEAKDAEIATQAKTIKELRYELEGTQDMAQFYSFIRSHPDWLDWDIVPVPEMPPEWKGHDDDGMKLDAAIDLVLGREIDQLYREL